MNTKAVDGTQSSFGIGRGFVLDTTFVLFFLALEFGRTMQLFTLDGFFLSVTMLMVLILPYFLPSETEKPQFNQWLLGRIAIAVLAVVLGFAFKQTLGVVLPETLRFLPLTLLIIASMISCYIQFYGLMRLRLAK